MKNYYAILGIGRFATSPEIKRAYLKKVKQIHPDRFEIDSPAWHSANAVLSEVNEAYACLRTPAKRKEYDDAFWGTESPPPQRGAAYTPPGQHTRANTRQYRYTRQKRSAFPSARQIIVFATALCSIAIAVLMGMTFYQLFQPRLGASMNVFRKFASKADKTPVKGNTGQSVSRPAPQGSLNDALMRIASERPSETKGNRSAQYIELDGWRIPNQWSVSLEKHHIRFIGEDKAVIWLKFQLLGNGKKEHNRQLAREENLSYETYRKQGREIHYFINQNLIDLRGKSTICLKTEFYNENGKLNRQEIYAAKENAWQSFSPSSPFGRLVQLLSEARVIIGNQRTLMKTPREQSVFTADYVGNRLAGTRKERAKTQSGIVKYRNKRVGTVTAKTADCRKSPVHDAQRIGKFQQGTNVFVTGSYTSQNGQTWYQVEYPAGSGWVRASSIKVQ